MAAIKFSSPNGRYIIVVPYAARWIVIEECRKGIVVEYVLLPHMQKRMQITRGRVRLFYSSIGDFLADCMLEDLPPWVTTGELI